MEVQDYPYGRTDVWICAPSDLAGDLEATLSTDEKERAARFRFDEDRRRFLAARTLLRRVAGQLLGVAPERVRFAAEVRGKPFVEGRPFELNLAHSGGLVAVAAGHEPVGIDVEQIKDRTPIDEIAGRYFHGNEIELLRSLPDARRRAAFFSLWTVKEAAMKADGGGLWLNLSSITIDDPARAGLEPVRCTVNGFPWLVRPLDAPAGYRAALATRTETTIVWHP